MAFRHNFQGDCRHGIATRQKIPQGVVLRSTCGSSRTYSQPMKSMLLAGLSALTITLAQAAPIKVLLIDGQNNHDWKSTSPILVKQLKEAGIFTVDTATAPASGIESFKPKFSDYQVVVSNYNGESWPDETKAAFEKFIKEGGGFVSVHAADNAFPEWEAYNEMIAIGGWGGRNEKSGPLLRFRDGKWVHDHTPGSGGHHGSQHEFVMVSRAPQHPIMAGLPEKWLHTNDELYDRLRGPAKNCMVLASAFSSPEKGGSGEEEPLILIVKYGKGLVFHTALGHDAGSVKCVGFATTFLRGTEWAATGKVTQKVPDDFPTEEKSSSRD
jgi:type 1 glutamine amidotransferase